jgi:hypothetical protein
MMRRSGRGRSVDPVPRPGDGGEAGAVPRLVQCRTGEKAEPRDGERAETGAALESDFYYLPISGEFYCVIARESGQSSISGSR